MSSHLNCYLTEIPTINAYQYDPKASIEQIWGLV